MKINQTVLNQLEKKYGKNVLRLGKNIEHKELLRLPTGIVALDMAIGGGIPLGRFIQISGAFSSTKSTTTYHILKSAQKMKNPYNKKEFLRPALISVEQGSYTDEYAELIGLDTNNLLVNESAGMEEALEVAIQLQKNEMAHIIAIDSIAALVPTKELDSGMDDTIQMGIRAKLLDEFFRKFQAHNNRLSREGKLPCTLIGINQLREKIGAHGDPEYEPGGRSVGFTSSLTIRLRRGEWRKVGTGNDAEIVGHQVKFKVSKSKVSKPFTNGDWDFYTEEGGPVPKGHVDNFRTTIIEAIAYGVIHKGGAWLSYKDIKEQGADKFIAKLREREDLSKEILDTLYDIAADKYTEPPDAVEVLEGDVDE